MSRTSILLDNELMLRVRQLARLQGKTLTALIHDALISYVNQHQTPQRRLSFTAIGKGKLKNASENAEEYIKSNLDRAEGFGRGNHR